MKDGRGGQTWISILVTVCQAIISDRIFPKPEKLNCLIATWDKRILKNIPRAWSGRAVIGWQVAWLDRYWSGSRRCQTRAVVAYIKVLRLLPCFCAPVLLFIHVPYSTTIFTELYFCIKYVLLKCYELVHNNNASIVQPTSWTFHYLFFYYHVNIVDKLKGFLMT